MGHPLTAPPIQPVQPVQPARTPPHVTGASR